VASDSAQIAECLMSRTLVFTEMPSASCLGFTFFSSIVIKSKGADCKDADSGEVNQSQF
jgi:hypothetical protein